MSLQGHSIYVCIIPFSPNLFLWYNVIELHDNMIQINPNIFPLLSSLTFINITSVSGDMAFNFMIT